MVLPAYTNALADRGVIPTILIFLVLIYSQELRPEIPAQILNIFTKTPVRFLLLSSTLVLFNHNPTLSFGTVAVFLAFMHFASSKQEGFTDYPQYVAVDPLCAQATVPELLDVFNGSEKLLRQYANDRGIIGDLKEYAPLIATHLLYSNVAVSKSCRKAKMDTADKF